MNDLKELFKIPVTDIYLYQQYRFTINGKGKYTIIGHDLINLIETNEKHREYDS